ncbi:MAG: hypothetical protein ACOZCO_03120 [Bacteroidota bacterium]
MPAIIDRLMLCLNEKYGHWLAWKMVLYLLLICGGIMALLVAFIVLA